MGLMAARPTREPGPASAALKKIYKKRLDIPTGWYIVHSMNYSDKKISQFQVKEFQDLIAALFQCCQERMQYQSERFALPDAELRCLMLFGEEKYLTPKGIARKMNVVKSRVSKILLGLEKRNLIYRIKDPEDSRGYILRLTSAGNKKLQKIHGFHDRIHHEVLAQMQPEQRKTLLNNLDLLKACMEAGKDLMD